MRNTQNIRLISGETIGESPYVALSYCWDLIAQLMLLPNNYSNFEVGVPFESLGKVAHGVVYADALFTITAAASKDTSQPFLLPRGPLARFDCQLREEEYPERYRSYIEGNPYYDPSENAPGNFALDGRGWCFQENVYP